MEYPKFKVCVRCFTFNQSKYITDTMNGFTMQQTDFPFVCCIVDDASTDGEQEVIRKYVYDNFDLSESSCHFERETDYAFITYAQHKSNKNCYFAVLYLKENHYSIRKPKSPYLSEWNDFCEYEAICEGDDYWIEPSKLQFQVKTLDSVPQCGMIGTSSYHFNEKQQKKHFVPINESKLGFADALIAGGIGCPTCTVLYRKEAAKGLKEFISGQSWLMGDAPLWLYILSKYDIIKINTPTAVYRVLPESASHSQSYEKAQRFNNSIKDIQLFFASHFLSSAIPAINLNANRRMFHTAYRHKKLQHAFFYAKKSKLSFKDYIRLVKLILINLI